MATIPLITAAGVVQMEMLTGGYGDNDVGVLVCVIQPKQHLCVGSLFVFVVFRANIPDTHLTEYKCFRLLSTVVITVVFILWCAALQVHGRRGLLLMGWFLENNMFGCY